MLRSRLRAAQDLIRSSLRRRMHPSRASGFVHGPFGVKSLSDCRVAEVLLLFVVSAELPHYAIREDAVSPSKTRAPPHEALTALLTA